jgi:hypothetical protein
MSLMNNDFITKPRVPEPYQGASVWGSVVIVAIICAIVAVGEVGWYFFSSTRASARVKSLQTESDSLDSQIATVNKWSTGTVESRSVELLSKYQTYKKLIDGRTAWAKVVPTISSYTLSGVSITGMSIDEKLAVKIDGQARSVKNETDDISAYGMAARQLVSYRDAETTIYPNDDATKTGTKVKVFSGVSLSSISKNAKVAELGGDLANFSISFSLNPDLLKLASIVAVQADKGTQ